MRSSKGWLELTWMGKDIAVISSEDSEYDGPRSRGTPSQTRGQVSWNQLDV